MARRMSRCVRDRRPAQPDNVVQPFLTQKITLYASETYVARRGKPSGAHDFSKHHFVGADDPNSRAPFQKWLRANVPEENIVFRSGDVHAQRRAILDGAGIGFMSQLQAREYDGLVEIAEPMDEWDSPLWLVTHMDLHRTTKVQTFLSFFKTRAKAWELS